MKKAEIKMKVEFQVYFYFYEKKSQFLVLGSCLSDHVSYEQI